MAKLLYRLGRFSARRAWIVIIAWVVALAATGGAFLAFGGALASSFSIPNTETERVTSQLAEEIPGTDGATGTVVFSTDSSSALDDGQRSQISALLADLTEQDGVEDVVDPFATAAQRAEQEQQLADGAAQLEAGRAQLNAGSQQLDAGRAQLEAGQQQLDAVIAGAQAAGIYERQKPALDAQQAQLDAGLAQLAAQQEQLDAGRTELAVQAAQLDAGQRLAEYASEISTVSADDSTALGIIRFEDDALTLSGEIKAAVAEELDAADIDGVTVDYSATIAQSVDGLLGPGEIIGVLLAAVVLLVMLRALLPALLPLVSSAIGVGVGVAGAMAFSGVVDMSSVTPVLGVMLGLAVGIDYSLFILNRHRRQVFAGMDVQESIGLANGTSGGAVVFAGSTVLIALVALTVTGIPFLGVMGIVGAGCVLIAVLIAITMTPALLGLLGPRVLSRRARARLGHTHHAEESLKPMGNGRAIATVLVAVVALLAVAVPALSMRLGLPDGSSESPESTQYRAYHTVQNQFGEGQNASLLVVAELPGPVVEEDVTPTQADLAGRLMEQDGVVAVAPAGVSDSRDFFAFQIVPAEGPTSASTEELVRSLRDASPLDGDIELGVAGQATGNIDVSEKLAEALPVYLAVVVGLSFLILILVFRSLLVPLIATAGFVLSVFAAFGGMTAVYQFGFLGGVLGVTAPGPLLSFAPIIVMGVLFGLAMDYQLFLVSGMREAYVHGVPAKEAVTAGLRNGRAVVTAAAIIMISVFGGFVFSHLTMVRPLGFGLAFGVLVDAFAVRMLLVPAVMHLLGKSAWWLPKWLDRILPNVDVEGAELERSHPVAAVPVAEQPQPAAHR
ncbi:MAG: transporter [Naasia sp.]|nr:transporter [Naasia sp.]